MLFAFAYVAIVYSESRPKAFVALSATNGLLTKDLLNTSNGLVPEKLASIVMKVNL